MKHFITLFYLFMVAYLLSICQNMKYVMSAPTHGNMENSGSRSRGFSRYYSRGVPYGPAKNTDTFLNEFNDDDDIFDLSKRQHSPNSDDYGHLRFGKRDEQFDDYGHMRFGRNGGDKK
ncbi:unnamed protein product [Ceutorhynchus assimilis]|uniref:Sulfakinin n=1 Tax=Ceutorhynchus assimilis TaxID=467358 RepID=A0A9N9MQ68_9CUCU|nr:unnamed protein product [Ceutorhynchus assimilis]